ncbi:MAG: PHP-associated domain-containing protein [Halobacteriaceae archaeon]
MTETRVDLHVKVLDEQVVRRAKARGLDVLVYAPHFTRLDDVRDRARRFSDDELLIVPAREVFTGSWRNRKHVLALGLEAGVPDFVSLEGAFDAFRAQGATVLAPHPEFLTVSLDRSDLRRYATDVAAVEVYNPKHLSRHNRRARAVRADLALPAFGSSYAHLPATVGEVWTVVEGPVDSTADLCDALERGALDRVERRSGPRHRSRCLAEGAHLFWENSAEKVDRVLLSGREATHPGQPAYEGRFDDVAVY